jgi:phosphate transport system protein
MGELVQSQIANAVQALVEGDVALGEQVITSDHRINALEVQIDDECARISARRQPAAIDLRFVIALSKTASDLERMGDQAERIGDRARNICEYVIYIVKGKDMRHTSLEDLEREAGHSA